MKNRLELAESTGETSARCRECGTESPPEARFCIQCGSGFQRAADAVEPPGARTGDTTERDPTIWSVPPELPPDPMIGRVIAGRYRVLAHLGSGGMGVVYRVEHVHIGKVMALKVLHDELARREDLVRRFRREAEAASRLASAHTVQVFDFGESDGRMYLVMEHVEGTNLEALVEAEGPLPFARAARLVAQVCASVAEAHAQGIVHRDLKPENVMVTRVDGRESAKVLDFGLAKLRFDPQSTNLTTMGLIVGTPEYMSPEQIRGENVDARGDVYAIGALLYHACIGRPPFEADAPFAVLTKHLTEPIVPPSRVAPGRVPREADAIVEKAMAKDPAERFASAAELRAALVSYLRGAGEDLTEPALRLDSGDAPGAGASSPGRPRLRIGTMDLDLEMRGRRGGARSVVDVPEVPRARRGPRTSISLVLALLVVGLGAFALFARERRAAPADPNAELEPNDELAEAGELEERRTLSAYIGQRRAPTRGDADVFRLVGSATGDAPVRVDVSGIPNLDLVLEVFEGDAASPRFVVDGGRIGEGEIAPNLPAPTEPYAIRVRERVAPGAHPIENVSDRYTVRWQRARVADDLEREPNDSLESAQAVRVGGAIEGYVGTTGDVDVYCLAGDGGAGAATATPIVARATGVAGLDLVVRVVDRVEATSRRVDTGSVGEPEETPPLAAAREGRTCFEVAARRPEAAAARLAAGGDEGTAPRSTRGDARYTFTIAEAPAAQPAPTPAAPAARGSRR